MAGVISNRLSASYDMWIDTMSLLYEMIEEAGHNPVDQHERVRVFTRTVFQDARTIAYARNRRVQSPLYLNEVYRAYAVLRKEYDIGNEELRGLGMRRTRALYDILMKGKYRKRVHQLIKDIRWMKFKDIKRRYGAR